MENKTFDLTLEEFHKLKSLRLNISYTQAEVDFLVDVNRRNVNPHCRTCYNCKNSIQTLKQELYGWFLSNEIMMYEVLSYIEEDNNTEN